MNQIFDEFMAKNYRVFLWYCQNQGQKPEDADEIVGEAFCRLHLIWKQRQDYDEIKNKKWMYNTIDNINKEYIRRYCYNGSGGVSYNFCHTLCVSLL